VEELEKQAHLSMGVLLTAAFVLLGFTLALEELVKPGVKPEPIAIFGGKLPTRYAPLLLLMAVSLIYLASICSAMTRCMGSGAPRGNAGAWLFFHPGREAVVLGLTLVCAAPVLHLLVLTRFITLLGWEQFQTARDVGCGGSLGACPLLGAGRARDLGLQARPGRPRDVPLRARVRLHLLTSRCP
jgi:hypothetical protein